MSTMQGQDFYLHRMSPNGRAVVTYHRTWDPDRFLAEAKKAAKEAEDDPAKRDTVRQASRQEYLDFKNIGKN